MAIRVDNRGYMRAAIALRKAFDAAIERRRAGADTADAMDATLITLMRDVLGDGGWTAFLTHAIVTLDPDEIDECHHLLAHIRATVREQGLLGWIFEMNDAAEQALDSGEPSDLMLDSWEPDGLDDPTLGEEERDGIGRDAMYDDMERFSHDARNAGALLLLRWADDDSVATAMRMARQMLTDKDATALRDIARELARPGAVDDPGLAAYLADRAADLDFPVEAEYMRHIGELAAQAQDALADDPLWAWLHGKPIADAAMDDILATGVRAAAPADTDGADDVDSGRRARRSTRKAKGRKDAARAREARGIPLAGLMGGLPAALTAPDDGADHGETDDAPGMGMGADRRYLEQERLYLHDVYRLVRGLADLWGMPAQAATARAAVTPPGDDAPREAFDAYLDEAAAQSRAARARFVATHHPGREHDPWLDTDWLFHTATTTAGTLLTGSDLIDAHQVGDAQTFAVQAGILSLQTGMVRALGLLRMPAAFIMAARQLAQDASGADQDAIAEQVHWEQRACADMAGMILDRIPDAPVARALAIELLRGDLGRYAEAADRAYAGVTPRYDA